MERRETGTEWTQKKSIKSGAVYSLKTAKYIREIVCALLHFSFVFVQNGWRVFARRLLHNRFVCMPNGNAVWHTVQTVLQMAFCTTLKTNRAKKNDINVHRDNSSNASHSINVWPVYRRRRRQRWRRWCRNNYMHARLVLLRAFPTPLPPFREMLSCVVSVHEIDGVYSWEVVGFQEANEIFRLKNQVGCNWMDLIMKMNVLSSNFNELFIKSVPIFWFSETLDGDISYSQKRADNSQKYQIFLVSCSLQFFRAFQARHNR